MFSGSCPAGTWPDRCVGLEANQTSCLVFESGAASWYYARSRCRQQGGDLAVPTPDVIKAIQESGQFLSQLFKETLDWVVGVRTVDWVSMESQVSPGIVRSSR